MVHVSGAAAGGTDALLVFGGQSIEQPDMLTLLPLQHDEHVRCQHLCFNCSSPAIIAAVNAPRDTNRTRCVACPHYCRAALQMLRPPCGQQDH